MFGLFQYVKEHFSVTRSHLQATLGLFSGCFCAAAVVRYQRTLVREMLYYASIIIRKFSQRFVCHKKRPFFVTYFFVCFPLYSKGERGKWKIQKK